MSPDEFWALTPGQFTLMIAGYNEEREYKEQRQARIEYLLRWPAAMAVSKSQQKKVDPLELMYIPEFDDQIIEARKKAKKRKKEKGRKALEKYRKLQGK